jgi:hypothetical protein
VCMFIGCKEEPMNDGYELGPYCTAHNAQIHGELKHLKDKVKWKKLLKNWEG